MTGVCSWCKKELEDSEEVVALSKWLYNDHDLCEPALEYICKNCYVNGALHVVIFYYDGVQDSVQVTYNEQLAKEWIQDFLDEFNYSSWDEYEESRAEILKHEIDYVVVPVGEIQ